MKISHIEHIGIAVANLEASVKIYEEVFGLKCYKIEEVPGQKVRTAFFRVGDTKIELLESTDPEGPIGKFIEKKGEGLHHIAFAVEDIKEGIADAISQGAQMINQEPVKGTDDMLVAFLHPKSTRGVLIEICEQEKQVM
ncbi:MAG: methylmalonyl-CoA epimerase [Bacteroidales bacterium]